MKYPSSVSFADSSSSEELFGTVKTVPYSWFNDFYFLTVGEDIILPKINNPEGSLPLGEGVTEGDG